MATILLVGTELPLLEGVAQTLGALGHQTHLAMTLADAADIAAAGTPPLLAVIQRDLAIDNAEALRIPLAPGGTLVLFRTQAEPTTTPLSAALQRAALADLALPLERQRLIARVHHVVGRAERVGRGGRTPPPPEQEAPNHR